MKTITIVFDPATCCDEAEPGEEAYDLFGQITNLLNDAGIRSEINEYDGDVRPAKVVRP